MEFMLFNKIINVHGHLKTALKLYYWNIKTFIRGEEKKKEFKSLKKLGAVNYLH